jgi:hypothetical protein
MNLLALHDVVVALQRRARRDVAEVDPACASVRSMPLDLAAGEARRITPLDLGAAVHLDVVRRAGLQADDRHQTRVGAREHLEIGAVDQNGRPYPVFAADRRETSQPPSAWRSRRDMRRHDHGRSRPARARASGRVRRPRSTPHLADGAEDHLEGVELLAPRRVGAREAKVPLPVDAMIEEELDVRIEELFDIASQPPRNVARAAREKSCGDTRG